MTDTQTTPKARAEQARDEREARNQVKEQRRQDLADSMRRMRFTPASGTNGRAGGPRP